MFDFSFRRNVHLLEIVLIEIIYFRLMHLFILSPPLNELGLPQCRVVSMSGTMGFSYLGLDEARAAYDPAEGLAITLLAERWLSASDSYEPGELTVTINQQTGSIVPRFD